MPFASRLLEQVEAKGPFEIHQDGSLRTAALMTPAAAQRQACRNSEDMLREQLPQLHKSGLSREL